MTQEIAEREPKIQRISSESHIPRDDYERPLVGLCGYVCHDPARSSREAGPDERPTCVVCWDLWEGGL